MDDRYQRVYDVGLLDDLHNYFPSLLYRPELFHNVQDVLTYVQRRTAARFNLFSHGQHLFMESEARANSLRNSFHRTPLVSPMRVPSGSAHVRRHQQPPDVDTNIEVELQPNTPLTAALDAAILPLLRNLYMPEVQQHRRIFRGAGLRPQGGQGFQDVIVNATQAQIDAASTTYTADRVYVERGEVCTICQDAIQEGEDVRHLNVCRHDFHRACIDNWLLRSSVICPTCRHDIRDPNPAPTARPSPQLTAEGPTGPNGPNGNAAAQGTPPPVLNLDDAAQDVIQMLFRGFTG